MESARPSTSTWISVTGHPQVLRGHVVAHALERRLAQSLVAEAMGVDVDHHPRFHPERALGIHPRHLVGEGRRGLDNGASSAARRVLVAPEMPLPTRPR